MSMQIDWQRINAKRNIGCFCLTKNSQEVVWLHRKKWEGYACIYRHKK